MTTNKAETFCSLHVKGTPLVLYNIWDAGSAKAVAEAGAKALATGSWSVAAAQGYGDGQAVPLDLLTTIVARIAATTELPLSVDFEGGYADEPEAVAANVQRIANAGAIGINFEDQRVGATGLHTPGQQSARISAIRNAMDRRGLDLFVNARTDLFLKEADRENHATLVAEAILRAKAYADAGASGFFVPGLTHEGLIAEICEAVPLPVNVMVTASTPPAKRLAELGVSRISHGPGPYRQAMQRLTDAASAAFGG